MFQFVFQCYKVTSSLFLMLSRFWTVKERCVVFCLVIYNLDSFLFCLNYQTDKTKLWQFSCILVFTQNSETRVCVDGLFQLILNTKYIIFITPTKKISSKRTRIIFINKLQNHTNTIPAVNLGPVHLVR